MIDLRVAHLISSLHVSAAASGAINLLRWLKRNQHEVIVMTTGGEREADIAELDIPIIKYEKGGPGWWLKGRRRLLSALKEWHPDLIHVHRLESVRLARDLANRLDIPFVSSVHQPVEAKAAEPLADPALVLVPSEAQRAHYAGRIGLARDRVAVLPYGLDVDRFRAEPGEGPVTTIGSVGHFTEDIAGFRQLVTAVIALREAGHEVKALLVGSGDRSELDQLVKPLGEHARIESSVAQTGALLAQMDVFVYPVESDTHSLSLLKAMASSCAVVASAVGGVPEMIRDGIDGVLVPPANHEALLGALTRLVEQPDVTHELAREARAYAEQHHLLDHVGEVAHELYRMALTGNTQGTGSTTAVTAWRRFSTRVDEGPHEEAG